MLARADGFAKIAGLNAAGLMARGMKRMRWSSALASQSEAAVHAGNYGRAIKATKTSLTAARKGIGDATTSKLRVGGGTGALAEAA